MDAARCKNQINEGKQIRESLTALKTFLIQTARKEIGADRSKQLVRLMRMILQKNGKLVLITNVNPELSCLRQTREALDFSSDIAHLKLNSKNKPISADEQPISHFKEFLKQRKSADGVVKMKK
jgi:hypothetical protein